METKDAILNRRSIRRFRDEKVPKEAIEKLLSLAVQAPSGKNRQPWRFIVLEGDKKELLTDVMSEKINTLSDKKLPTGSCRMTIKCMRQASAIILIFNSEFNTYKPDREFRRHRWMVDIQSIGAAIQTIVLSAHDMGLGTLWICDVFYADEEICELLGRKDELVAAVAIGYPDESPSSRPRISWQEITDWLD